VVVGEKLPNDFVYCTAACRAALSPDLRGRFRNLDELVLKVAGSAVRRLIIVSPYLGTGAIAALRPAMAVSAERGAWIRLVTDFGEAGDVNREVLGVLVRGEEGRIVRERLRVLTGGAECRSFLHAKMMIADGERGYLGSANLSGRAFDENLEVGLALMPSQAKALDEMISLFESSGFLQDCTESVLGRAL
jgi:phosphatidylserine/phosphatidylglycerophosphate/cardiolipin synthase-like enzyme